MGALGCAEVEGCNGRFCAECLPGIQAGIAAGKLCSCPSCRRSEPPTGPGGARASLRLCRDFDRSRTDNAFELIVLPPPPPRGESAAEDDAQMAAGLQEGEQAAWVRRAGAEARRRRLEESDARLIKNR